MKNNIKKRGQKFVRKFSRASLKASEESREHIRENFVARISHIQSIRLLIFEWVLLVTALILLAVAQAFWFGDSYAVHTFVEGGNYVEATVGKINSLNPLFATTSSEKTLSRLMFATIVENDYSGNPGLGLAKSIHSSESGKVWSVHLKDGLKWSDGEPITNEDAIFTINLIQSPSVNSIYDANLENVKVSEAENGDIVFTLPSAYADFVSALNFPILPKHKLEDAQLKTLIEDEFSTSPVTSGAFMYNAAQIATTSDAEKVVYLSANPNYYMGKPLIGSFAVHSYNTKEDLITAVNTGSVTATAELSGPEVKEVTSTSFAQKNSSISSGAFIFFNLSNKQLSNVDLRRAIREGINLEDIRSAAPDTTALNYPFLSSQIDLTAYPGLPETNVEAAKAKIAEIAGGNPLQLNIATVTSGYLPDVAEKLANSLRELGINSEVFTYAETQDFVTSVISKRNYDILVYEMELGADPDVLAYYHSSQANASGLNLSNYRNSLVDDLIIGARETTDEALRVKKYETFLNYWVSDVPAIGLYQPNLTYIYNKNVRPYSNDVKLVTAFDRFTDIEDWAASKGTKNKTP